MVDRCSYERRFNPFDSLELTTLVVVGAHRFVKLDAKKTEHHEMIATYTGPQLLQIADQLVKLGAKSVALNNRIMQAGVI